MTQMVGNLTVSWYLDQLSRQGSQLVTTKQCTDNVCTAAAVYFMVVTRILNPVLSVVGLALHKEHIPMEKVDEPLLGMTQQDYTV